MSTSRDKMMRTALTLTERGRYDQALATYRKLYLEEPGDVRVALRVGELRAKTGAFGKAFEAYDHAGAILAEQGFVSKAIDTYERALDVAMQCVALDERVVQVAQALVDLYREDARTVDALPLLLPLERRFARERQPQSALAIVRLIIAVEPTATAYRIVLGDMLARAGAIDESIAQLGTSVEQLIELGASDDAIAVLERILSLRADAKHARLAAERYLLRAQSGDGLRALAALKLCCNDDPKNLGILSLMASAFRLAGFASKAADVERIIARISVSDAIDAGWDESPSAHDSSEVEAALDRVNNLVAASRIDEARAIVRTQLLKRPTNMLLVERAEELDAMVVTRHVLPSPAAMKRRASDTFTSPVYRAP